MRKETAELVECLRKYGIDNEEMRDTVKRWSSSFGGALANKREWEITPEHYRYLISFPCHYCGRWGDNKYKRVGLDRKDNRRGYTFWNVVPCCHRCNKTKSHHLNFEQMEKLMSDRWISPSKMVSTISPGYNGPRLTRKPIPSTIPNSPLNTPI